MRRLIITVQRGLWRNVDLLAVWMGLLIAQHHVPVTHFLGRNDLVPWMILTLSIVAFLRGRRFGLGPHPMLTPRIDTINAMIQRAAAAVAPWTLMYLWDAARLSDPQPVGLALGVVGAVVVLVAFGGSHGQTAWNPERGVPVGTILSSAALLVGAVAVAGWAGAALGLEVASAASRALLVGLSFLTIGLMQARIQNQRQRAAAGRKDGQPHGQQIFPAFLAVFGPFVTLTVVFAVVHGVDFDQAFVVSLLVVVWAGIVWPAQSPVMVSCVLHEVIPTGGADPRPSAGQANAFDVPPEGALRFNPLRTRRTLVQHPWMVPVRSSRIAELDDPVKPLWQAGPPLLPEHLLGDAAFEPDPLTRQDQWEVLTIRLRGRSEVQSMSGGDAQVRRIVVLRALPAPGQSSRARMATYRWEEDVPEGSVQVLDPTTEVAELRDGDVLVISAEGVARAYEIEIGAPVYRQADANAFRAPQLEDYVEAG
jgi:hypothetical protein